MDGQFYKFNTAFCYIQLKKSIRVLHPPAKFCTKSSQIVPSRRIRLVWFLLAVGSRHIMSISARIMFVPGGRLARRLGLGRLSFGSQRIFYVNVSLRLLRCRCRDTI